MKKIGIYYGSLTGTTEQVARKIAALLSVDSKDVHDVAKSAPSSVAGYDMLILGTSTWGEGELDEAWLDFLPGLEVLTLRGKQIALFGCGDETMSETFCDGVGHLYERLIPTGATFVGQYPADCYSFEKSRAVVDGEPVGLLLDQVNHPELTELRLRGWCDEIAAK